MSRTGGEKDTCTACAGSMLLEFSALSRLTGNTVFEVCHTALWSVLAAAVDFLTNLMLVVSVLTLLISRNFPSVGVL